MRTTHALVLLVALVAILVASLFWLGGKDPVTEVAEPAPELSAAPTPGANDSSSAPLAGSLSTEPSSAGPAERARVETPAAQQPATVQAEVLPDGLRGRVIDPAGKPVADALVYAGPDQGMNFGALDAFEPSMAPWIERYDGKTGADGTFRLAYQPKAGLRLAVRAANYAPLDAQRTLSRGELDLGDITLEQGVILEGRVVDPSGTPVAGAELYSRPTGMGGMVVMAGARGKPLAKTDNQGRFRIDRLASGPWRLLISSEEHPDKNVQGSTERPGERKTDLSFQLDEGAAIEGRVTAKVSVNFAELNLSALKRNEEDSGAMMFGAGFAVPRRAKVRADGTFRIGGLTPNANYRLSVKKGEPSLMNMGMGMGGNEGLAAKAGDRNVEVAYTPDPAIVFQVVDAASGASLTELDVKAGYGWNMPLMGKGGKLQREFPEGKVRFENVPPKMQGFGGGGNNQGLKLRVDATGYKPYEKSGLELPAEGDLDLGVLRLEPNPVCEVTVLDLATGAPVAGAEVTLEKITEDTRQARGMRMGMRFMTRGVDSTNDENSSRAKTNAQGLVRLQSFPGSNAQLSIEAQGYADYTGAELLLPSEKNHTETVRLSRGGEIAITVLDSFGKPVAGVAIEHRLPGEKPTEEERWMNMFSGRTQRTDARGELLLVHQVLGEHQLRVQPRDQTGMRMGGGVTFRMSGREEEPVVEPPWSSALVSEGSRIEIRLVTEPICQLEGVVREAGRTLAGAMLEVADAESDSSMGGFSMASFGMGGEGNKTDGQGRYKLEDLKPGRAKLVVRHPSRAMEHEVAIDLVAGGNRIDVDLPSSTIEGFVRDEQGRGIPGIKMRVERAQGGSLNAEVSVMMSSDMGETVMSTMGGQESVETDADGRYVLRGVMPDVDLFVRATGKDMQPAKSDKVRLALDQVLSNVNITLRKGGTVEVRVKGFTRENRNSFGMIEGRRLDQENASPQMEGLGRNGVARFRGLEPGKWSFKIMDMGFNPETGEATAPKDTKTVEIEVIPGKTQKVELDPN
jgi:protocatechuate 3,4-dioxygenase beta subunit